MNINKTLLICDMDGTLLNSESKISNENYEAIKSFTENGGLFTVATGRMKNAVMPHIEKLPINVPAILYNGAVIYDFNTNNILWEDNLPDESIIMIKEIINKFPEIGVEIFYGDNLYFLKENEETEEHKKRENFHPLYVPINKIPLSWYKALFAGKPDKLKLIENYLMDKILPFRCVYSEPQFLELLGKNVSKGRALDELVKILGISNKNVIVVGDNLNDLELIKTAGTGIAVENAHPELKKVADSCSGHHNNHAISQIINWINNNKNNSLMLNCNS